MAMVLRRRPKEPPIEVRALRGARSDRERQARARREVLMDDAAPDRGRLSQQAIRGRCLHPSGTFREFERARLEQSVPAAFEGQVDRTPGRLAVKDAAGALTYADLNRLANRLAHAILGARGTRAEPVALLLGRSAALIVATIGV